VSFSPTFYIVQKAFWFLFSVVFVFLANEYWQEHVCKILVKLTTGIDFINILCAAFTLVDSKSAKNTDGLTAFFELLGSALVKAARKCW